MYKSPIKIPLINLKKITNIPLAVYIGVNDNLVTPTDGIWLKSQLQGNLSYYREMANFDNFQLVNFPSANKIDYFDNDMLVKIKAANPLDFSFPVINVFVNNNTVDNSTTNNTNSTTNNTSNNTIVNPPNIPTPSPNIPTPSPNNPTPSPNIPTPSPNNPTPNAANNNYQAPAPAKPLRFLYNPGTVQSFWGAISRDFFILLSHLPLFSILFRDIPFWFNVVVLIMQIFGIDQDDSLVVMGFLFKNKDAVLLLRQQALLLNIVPKYERYAKNGNPFAMEFVKVFKDSD